MEHAGIHPQTQANAFHDASRLSWPSDFHVAGRAGVRADWKSQVAGSLPDIYHLWGPAVDQLLAQERFDDGGAEDVSWVLTDHLGSVRDLAVYDDVLEQTSVVTHYVYDAFGNVSVTLGDLSDTRYLFTCQEYDLTTGHYYYDARWYDPATGKFISEDLKGFGAGDANLSRYVENQATIATDPTGHELFSDYEETAQTAVGWLAEIGVQAEYQPLPSGFYHVWVTSGMGTVREHRDAAAEGSFNKSFYQALANWNHHELMDDVGDGYEIYECGVRANEWGHVYRAHQHARRVPQRVPGHRHQLHA